MTKPTTVPAWKCPTCGRTHPITVTECCGPSHKWNPRRGTSRGVGGGNVRDAERAQGRCRLTRKARR